MLLNKIYKQEIRNWLHITQLTLKCRSCGRFPHSDRPSKPSQIWKWVLWLAHDRWTGLPNLWESPRWCLRKWNKLQV